MLNFSFLEKDPKLFVHHIFLMLYAIKWPNFILSLPLLLEILGNMCTVTGC